MASTKFKVNGLEVEMWETSFRVEGMYLPIQIGPHMTQPLVESLVVSVYDAVEARALRSGKLKLANAAKEAATSFVDALLNKELP